MSTQDIRKLSTVVRSIEIIEEKTDALHSQFTNALNESETKQPPLIDDSNIDLQTFFQHLEQLLEIDLKNRSFLLNNANKKTYWNFFSLALKESKGLYDTVLHVNNSQEVKTNTGRGRLFIRFCLQTHRLGDVIQHSFMMAKLVNQFYVDDCLWTTPTYINRIIQALYLLNDLQFDLLNNTQYQLDVSWPTTETVDIRPKNASIDPSRMRNESASSLLSMNSVDSQSIVSVVPDINDVPQGTPIFANLDSSINGDSCSQSISSVDANPENTLAYWKEKCHQLEMQLHDIETSNVSIPSTDMEIQCLIEESDIKETIEKLNEENERLKYDVNLFDEKNAQLIDDTDRLKNENDEMKSEIECLKTKVEQMNVEKENLTNENDKIRSEINVLREEVNHLNFQLSSFSMQRTMSSDKAKEYERDLLQHQTTIQEKDLLIKQLKLKFDQLTTQLQLAKDDLSAQVNIHKQRIILLENDLDKTKKSLNNERLATEKDRNELNATQEKLEAALHERTLDFEEMKRRLLKAIREKAELFEKLHNYEVQFESEQPKKWVADEDVDNCMKCNAVFGWTVRKHHCRHCQSIYCHQCSNNWHSNSKNNPVQYRVCDYCNEKLSKDSADPSRRATVSKKDETDDNVDLRFEVRPERLNQSQANT